VSVEVIACDPLAPLYDSLIAEAGVQPPVRTVFAPAEDLSVFFPRSSFDIVHCRNALDHSIDPVRGLEEMLRVMRVGGSLVLRHHANEAEREAYVGLHQFNIDEQDGRLVFWNKAGSIEPLKHMPVRVDARIFRVGGDVNAVLVKRGEFPTWDGPERTAERLRHLLKATVTVLAGPSPAKEPSDA
jgi:SAM-dependent methyltransferase